MSARQLAFGDYRTTLLPTTTIHDAVTGVVTDPIIGLVGMTYLAVQTTFVYGAGGTSVDAWIQTSLDAGVSWIDVMNFHFTTATGTKVSAVVTSTALAAAVTPGDAALGANTILSGLLGDRVRAKYTSTGTYTGANTLTIDMVAKG